MTLDERKSLVKSYLGKTVDIIIDRPIGYVHKKKNYTLTYPINYGYIPGVLGGDGEELDVYLLGTDKPVNEYRAKIIGIVYRKNDIEDKLIAAPENMIYNQAQIAEAIHFQEQYYDTCVEAVYQKSCGVIVYRTVNGKREYLCLLQNISGTYSVPKGHLEAFESEQDCAKRELFEETGIKTQLIDGFKTEFSYTFNTNSGTKHKSLTLFLAEYNGELNIDKNEIISYKWLDAEKAKQILPKGNDKVIDSVEEFLTKTHNMKLWLGAFGHIADGSKTIELRLNDEKRQQINVGDTIVFNCTKNNDTITARVKALHKFADFRELYSALPLDKCGYTANEAKTAKYTDMYDYYTEEQIKKYGALGIELCDIVFSKG